MWANVDARHRIDARDRPTPGPDFYHFDYGDADRDSTPFQEAVLTRHFKGPRKMRLPVIDKTDLCCRPAHVERNDTIQIVLRGEPGREDRAAGRARFDQTNREPPRKFNARESASRGDQEHRCAEALLTKGLFEFVEIP